MIEQDCNKRLQLFGLQALVQLLHFRDKETETQVMKGIAQATQSFNFSGLLFLLLSLWYEIKKLGQVLWDFFESIASEKFAKSKTIDRKGSRGEIELNQSLLALLFEQRIL